MEPKKATRPSWRAGRAKKRWRDTNGMSIAERTALGGEVMGAMLAAMWAVVMLAEAVA